MQKSFFIVLIIIIIIIIIIIMIISTNGPLKREARLPLLPRLFPSDIAEFMFIYYVLLINLISYKMW